MLDNIYLRSITLAQSYVPAAPPITKIQNDIAIHEFDRTLAAVSIELLPKLLVDSIICKVRTRMTRNGFVTITEDRHHGVSP